MKFASLLISLVLAVASGAAEYRVTSAADIKALGTKLQPGDAVVMKNGTWENQTIVMRAHGSETQPIALRAETPGQVVLTGTSTLDIDGDWLVVSGILVRDGSGPAHGIAIRGHHNRLTETAMIGGTYKHFLRMWGTDSRVDHCYFEGKTSGEPTFQVEAEESGPNNHRIDHNHFGPRPPLGRNGGETMRIGYSGQSMNNSRTLVEQNLFDRCDGEIEIISSKSCENIYRWNTFLDCDGMLTLRHGNRCVIDANFFFGHHKKGSGGVRVIGEDHIITNNYFEGITRGIWITAGVPNSALNQYFTAKRCVIAFNTMVDSSGAYLDLANGLDGAGRTLKPEDMTIANNLFALGQGGSLLTGNEGANWHWQGNVITNAKPEHAGLRRIDVTLNRATDDLLRPSAASVVRGAAEGNYSRIKADIDGQPRSGKLDVGCDQISDAPITNHPLTAAEVGPRWLKR